MGMDNNGVFSGLSMVSEQNNGTVRTSIGFQADRIFSQQVLLLLNICRS